MADAPNEPPTPMSNVPMASEPTDSNLPWPYGWSTSAGSEDMRTESSVRPSEKRSEKVWPASAIMAVEWPYTPANALKTPRKRFTHAPTQVMRDPFSSYSAFFCCDRVGDPDPWREMIEYAMSACMSSGRKICTCRYWRARAITGQGRGGGSSVATSAAARTTGQRRRSGDATTGRACDTGCTGWLHGSVKPTARTKAIMHSLCRQSARA